MLAGPRAAGGEGAEGREGHIKDACHPLIFADAYYSHSAS